MKKIFKQTFAIIMTVVMIFTIAPLSSFAMSYEDAYIEEWVCGIDNNKNLIFAILDTNEDYLQIGSGENGAEMKDWAYDENDPQNTMPDWLEFVEEIKSVGISDGITKIGANAFRGCKNMTKVFIGASVAKIGDNAFRDCEKLEYVELCGEPTSIGKNVFDGCASLERARITRGTTTLRNNVFRDCTSLTTIILPDTIKKVEDDAFSGCDNLKTIKYEGTPAQWNKITVSAKGNESFKNAEVSYNYVYTEKSTPKLISVTNTVSGPQIKWEKVDDAGSYRVYRKNLDNLYYDSFEPIVGTTNTSYIDIYAENGTNYIYTVKAFKGGSYGKHESGIAIKCMEAPQVSSVVNSVTGPYIKWNAIESADSYQVWRKTGANGTWAKIGTSNTTNYRDTDKNLKSGTTYYYTVKSVSGTYTSSMRAGTGIKVLNAPQITSIQNAVDSTYMKWNSVVGATEYEVQRRTADGEWQALATVTTTNYRDSDTSLESGKPYYYTIKAISGNTESSRRPGTELNYLAAPQLTSIQNAVDSTYMKWNSVVGATQYQVQRRTADGAWKAIATVTTTNYKDSDKTLESSKTYYYSIKALNGKNTSSMRAGTGINVLSAPQITSVQNAVDSTYLKWNKVIGATEYEVQRRTTDGEWKAIATVTTTNYRDSDTSLESGKTYYYTIKALNEETESSRRAGTALRYLTSPQIESITNSAGKPYLKWNQISGASGYQVYRKTGANGTWAKIATTSAISYKDTSAKGGTTYYYSIKSYNGTTTSSMRAGTPFKTLVICTSLTLNAKTINWPVGKSGSFKATVLPDNAVNKTLVWTSSKSSVATITQTGKLTAVGVGTTTITCKTTDGSNLSVTCKVTVYDDSLSSATYFNKLNNEFFSKGRFTIEGTMSAIVDGKTMNLPFKLARDGKNQYVYTQYTYDDLTLGMLINNQKTYLLIPEYKLYQEMDEGNFGESDFSGLTDVKTYVSTKRVKIGQVTYICEEIKGSDGYSTFFYFDESTGSLKRIKFNDAEGESTLIVKSIKATVNKSEFAIPSGYTKTEF